METAARRPRPNRERLLPWLDRKLSPTCPALFAARMTSPTKVCGRLAPRLPWLIRPGRTRRSSSPVVMAPKPLVQRGDGARSFDFFWENVESASSGHCCRDQILLHDQPHRPDRRPAFSLAIHGRSSPALALSLSDLRQIS